jgi:hypothetical protein
MSLIIGKRLLILSGARNVPRPLEQTTFSELTLSELLKPMAKPPRTDHSSRQLNNTPKLLELKKMDRTELLENVAGWVAGVVTGTAFIVLYVALATPVAETVQKFLA